MDSTWWAGRAVGAALDPFFVAPFAAAALPAAPEGRSFVAAATGCRVGSVAGAPLDAAGFCGAAGFLAAVAGVATGRAGVDFDAAFFTATTGAAFFAGALAGALDGAFAGAFAGALVAAFDGALATFFTGAFATGRAAAFFAGAFFAAGLAGAVFFAAGLADLLVALATFFAVFLDATSAVPSSLEAGKRAVIPCRSQRRQPRGTSLRRLHVLLERHQRVPLTSSEKVGGRCGGMMVIHRIKAP